MRKIVIAVILALVAIAAVPEFGKLTYEHQGHKVFDSLGADWGQLHYAQIDSLALDSWMQVGGGSKIWQDSISAPMIKAADSVLVGGTRVTLRSTGDTLYVDYLRVTKGYIDTCGHDTMYAIGMNAISGHFGEAFVSYLNSDPGGGRIFSRDPIFIDGDTLALWDGAVAQWYDSKGIDTATLYNNGTHLLLTSDNPFDVQPETYFASPVRCSSTLRIVEGLTIDSTLYGLTGPLKGDTVLEYKPATRTFEIDGQLVADSLQLGPAGAKLKLDSDGTLYYYDSSVSKWLSVQTDEYLFSRNAFGSKTFLYLAFGDGIPASGGRRGYLMPHDARLVSVVFSDDTTYNADSVKVVLYAGSVTNGNVYYKRIKDTDRIVDTTATQGQGGTLTVQAGDVLRAWLDPDGTEYLKTPVLVVKFRRQKDSL